MRAAGIEHVVAQSVQDAAAGAPVEVMRAHAASEELLRASGIRWTIVRPNSFMQNLLVFAPAIRAGRLPVPAAGVRLSLVDARDVAEVAATLLMGAGHVGRIHELTGPARLGFAELAEHLGAAIGRTVRYLPVPPSTAAAAMRETGATEFAVDTALAHLRYWSSGVGARLSPSVERLLGRPPRSFSRFVADHARLLAAAPMIRRWFSQLGGSWNATAAEQSASCACDTYLDQPRRRLTRTIDVAAHAPVTYRWLCQLKVAPYSYDLLDNAGKRSPRTLTPGAENLAVGQPLLVFTVTDPEPDRHISGTGRASFSHLYGPLAVSYTVVPRGHDACRVVVRLNIAADGRSQRARATALALGDLIMMRKQLLTLKSLAEADAASCND